MIRITKIRKDDEAVAIRSETELYAPVKQLFESFGYEVKGEIRSCDLIAVKQGEAVPTIVELKRSFNLQLLFQAVRRLKWSERVYVAVEYSPRKRAASYFSWNDAADLCRRIGIGLIGVQFYKRKPPAAYILCEPPLPVSRPKPGAAARKLLGEFNGRSGDYNVGGSTKRKLVTAYRERALRVARLLDEHGVLAPRQLREMLRDAGVPVMLQKNYYGWFERVSPGRYRLSAAGREALEDFAHVAASDAADSD